MSSLLTPQSLALLPLQGFREGSFCWGKSADCLSGAPKAAAGAVFVPEMEGAGFSQKESGAKHNPATMASNTRTLRF
jgi:hypothetical protein